MADEHRAKDPASAAPSGPAPAETPGVVPLGPAAEVLGRRLAPALARRRMDLILEKPHAAQLVRALPAEDLYFLIKDVGLEDAAPLVALASPEQFQSFVDLDCWRPEPEGPVLDTARVLRWLAVARAGDEEAARAKAAALDLEVMERCFQDGLRIVDLREQEEKPRPDDVRPGDEDLEWHTTDGGAFRIAFLGDQNSVEGAELRRLLQDLYAANPFAAERFLAVVRWELKSDLEEHALRFRTGRLEDLGFPPREVALSLYAHVDPDAPAPPQPRPVDPVPGFFLSEFRGASFLDRCAGKVVGVQTRTTLDRALVYLTNSVLVADQIDPGDLEAVREAIARMRAYLNLGLYRMAGGDEEAGARILATRALKHVFRVGFSLTLELRWRLDRMARSLALPAEDLAAALDAPERQVLEALLLPRPMYPLALDAAREAGWPEAPEASEAAERAPLPEVEAGRRPFATPEDLAAASEALSRADAFLELARDAGLLYEGDEALEPAPLSVRLLTAGLARAAGRTGLEIPLDAATLEEGLGAALTAEGTARPGFRTLLLDFLGERTGAPGPLAEALVDRALHLLEDRAGPAWAAGEFDPELADFVSQARPGTAGLGGEATPAEET
ncbi:MAG: hypothetical protein D6729_00945 [Deltaproteobacteria bacterium]|nr:MAG: hypothetical protein D6729_00945 [Deltaproteobacteria bacterium]